MSAIRRVLSTLPLAVALVGQSASYTTFGPGCAGSMPVTGLTLLTPPRPGGLLQVDLDNLPAGAAILFTGLSNSMSAFGPLPFALSPFGMPGCALRIRPESQQLVLGLAHQATCSFSIPPWPGLAGLPFYQQALVYDPAAPNQVGAVVSDAAAGVIGFSAWNWREAYALNLGSHWCENHLAVADFDRDGVQDIALVITAHVAQVYSCQVVLLRGLGNQQFAPSILTQYANYGYWASAGDLDGDGWMDLVVREGNGTHVLRNDGMGRLVEVYSGGPGFYALDLVDLDRNGSLDLLSGTQTPNGGQVEVFPNTPAGISFTPAWQSQLYGGWLGTMQQVKGVDLDRDSFLDVAAIEIYSGQLLTWRGNGTGTLFTPWAQLQFGTRTFAMSVGNVDGDPYPDVAVFVGWGEVRIFHGSQSGVLTPGWVSPPFGTGGFNLELRDFDGDGFDDLFVGTFYGGQLRVFENDRASGFRLAWSSTLPGEGYTGTVADVDLDGRLDLIVGEMNRIRIFYRE